MAGRRLGADERALWARVIASVTPLDGREAASRKSDVPVRPETDWLKPANTQRAVVPTSAKPPANPRPAPASNTLDGGWDRRIRRGVVDPDMTVDLHGHTLDSAWRLLDTSLARAVTGGTRIILLVTGKPPQGDRRGRGAIRGAVGDWLASSRHADRIAAVRNAHPRHGGNGALYIILKRDRTAS